MSDPGREAAWAVAAALGVAPLALPSRGAVLEALAAWWDAGHVAGCPHVSAPGVPLVGRLGSRALVCAVCALGEVGQVRAPQRCDVCGGPFGDGFAGCWSISRVSVFVNACHRCAGERREE